MKKKIDFLSQVEEFHEAFGHPILEKPQIPNPDRCKLRMNLLSEELGELQEAIDNLDIEEAADAFCDIQYVLSGAILEFGLADKFKDLFDEVHSSNMSKACFTMKEAEETVAHYLKEGVESYIKESNGLFLVYRKSDNKTLKSVNYSKANLSDILNK